MMGSPYRTPTPDPHEYEYDDDREPGMSDAPEQGYIVHEDRQETHLAIHGEVDEFDLEAIICHFNSDIADALNLVTLPEEEYAPEVLHELRTQQAEIFEKKLIEVNTGMRYSLLIMGWMLDEGGKYNYAQYRGHDTIQEWCTVMEISPARVEEARKMVEVYPFLRDLGFNVHELVDPRFTVPKLDYLRDMNKYAERQKKLIQIEKAKEILRSRRAKEPQMIIPSEIGDLLNDNEDEEEEESQIQQENLKNARALMAALTPEEREEVKSAAQQSYKNWARAEVTMVREQSPGDFNAHQLEKRGQRERPCITLNLTYKDGRLSWDHGSCIFELPHAEALESGQYSLVMRMNDLPMVGTMVPKQVGKHIKDIMAEEENARFTHNF